MEKLQEGSAKKAQLEEIKQQIKELEEQMDQQFSQIADLQKILYDNIVSIQKDNAIIMETLQLILTNMLIDNVKTPNKNPKIIAPERKRKQ